MLQFLLDVAPDQDLTWLGGQGAMFHTVYFGSSREAVEAGTATSWTTIDPAYDPGPLEIGTTCY